MPQVDDIAGRVTFKIVYYGPGLAGRSTNAQCIISHIDPEYRAPASRVRLGDLTWDGESGTLSCAFTPRSLSLLPDRKQAWLRLVVPPAANYIDARRRNCLNDVDGIVFVADSQAARFEANIDALEELKMHLDWYGINLAEVPRALQLNKQDMPELVPTPDLIRELRVDSEPVFEAIASRGEGVFESLKAVVKQILARYCMGVPIVPVRKHPGDGF